MYSNPRIKAPSAAYAGGGAAATLTARGPPPAIVSIRAKSLNDTVSMPSSGSTFNFRVSGDLTSSVGDAHPRSEAAFPIVSTFVSYVVPPADVGERFAVQKGAPILFLPLSTKFTPEGRVQGNSPTNGVASFKSRSGPKTSIGTIKNERRFTAEHTFAAFVGGRRVESGSGKDNEFYSYTNVPCDATNKTVALSSGFLAYASEQFTVNTNSASSSNYVPIAAVLEHNATITFERSNPATCVLAGSMLVSGVEAEYPTVTRGEGVIPTKFSVKTRAGTLSDLANATRRNAEKEFVAMRTGTVLVPASGGDSSTCVIHGQIPPSLHDSA